MVVCGDGERRHIEVVLMLRRSVWEDEVSVAVLGTLIVPSSFVLSSDGSQLNKLNASHSHVPAG